MRRSSEVSLIATLQFVLAGLLVLVAVGAVVGGPFVGAFLGAMGGSPFGKRLGGGLGFAIGFGIAFGCLIRAALNFLCGWGVWSLKEWGRILTIVLCALSLLGSFAGVFSFRHVFHFGLFGMWRLLWAAVNIWIIYTLVQPQVRAQFR